MQAIKLSAPVRCLSFAGGNLPAKTQNVIGNKFLDSNTDRWIDVHNPATNEVVTKVKIIKISIMRLMGSSKNYVDKISLFFTIYLPIVDIRGHFANHLPFVHVDSDINK